MAGRILIFFCVCLSELDGLALQLGPTPIIASIYTSGRDEQYFTKADQFLPHRWDRHDLRKQDLANHIPSATMPFALGARSCIGRKMALLQLTELLSKVVHHFDFKCANSEKVTPVTTQVLMPSNPIELIISPRNSQSKTF